MTHGVQEMARSLLKHVNLSSTQATVFFDDSTDPGTFRVYVFDPTLARREWRLTTWQGYRVEFKAAEPPRPLHPHGGRG